MHINACYLCLVWHLEHINMGTSVNAPSINAHLGSSEHFIAQKLVSWTHSDAFFLPLRSPATKHLKIPLVCMDK